MHLHALIAGGALTDMGVWIRPKKGSLFPVKALSRVFRGKCITGMENLRKGGRMPAPLMAPADLLRLNEALYALDRAVYAKHSLGGPEVVLESGQSHLAS